MDLLLYKLVIACLIVSCYSDNFPPQGCVRDPLTRKQTCIISVYCREHVDDIHFYFEDGDYCHDDPSYDVFRDNYGRKIKRVNVVFKDTHGRVEAVPLTYNDNERWIYSLDLSENYYSTVPPIRTMNNLNKLNLSSNWITTATLSNRNDLPSLVELDYSHNSIDKIEVIPDEYPYRSLKKLNMSHNNLVNLPEAVFESVDDLELLDLSHNYIYTISVLTFEGIRKLFYLNLSNNRLIELNSALLRFSDLATLDLSVNHIQALKSNDFKKLVNLNYLNLKYNHIDSVEKHVFENTTELATVDLRNNALVNIDQQIFVNATKLNSVYLSQNKLKSLPKYMFKGKDILHFSIEDNELEGALEKGLFEGLSLVTELDMSGQHLSSIENYAFSGLTHLNTLLLNKNGLTLLSNYAFKGLQNLITLDLSYNNITKLDIVTDDLISLQMLLLHHNKITTISSNNFLPLNLLQYLDLSHNSISHLNTNSFKSLRSLLTFKISQNPISGALEGNTFNGLNSLPSLDVSGSSITILNNGSFMGMTMLKELNISHSKITELEFNSLSYLNSIEIIDLSFNMLTKFEINTTDLTNVRNLILNNNFIQDIADSTFLGINNLAKIVLSHNVLRSLGKETFEHLSDLTYLDLSYNGDLKFDVSLIEKCQTLTHLFISRIQADIGNENITNFPVTILEIEQSDIRNITQLKLRRFQNLQSLDLRYNKITEIEVGAFSNLTTLRQIDLSFNNLSFVQPGAFKDNTNLDFLNISHNILNEITYGFFRGLINLRTLDLSFNNIQSLHKGRLYEAEHLETLIADYNTIDSIYPEEFSGTQLSTLSIGDNPLPCEILANLKRGGFVEFTITALYRNEVRPNVDGVTCNKDDYRFKINPTLSTSGENDKLLIDIRNILYNISTKQGVTSNNQPVKTQENTYLANITEQQIQLLNYSMNTLLKLSSVSNLTSTLVNVNSNSNLLLGKILRQLTLRDSKVIPTGKPVTIGEGNVTMGEGNITSQNIMSYINKMKEDLEETIAIEKRNLLELENKIEKLNSLIDSRVMSTTKNPIQDKLVSVDNTHKSMFTEVCVGLILVILVGFLLFKLYKSKLYIPSSRSFNSTRNITECMENSEV